MYITGSGIIKRHTFYEYYVLKSKYTRLDFTVENCLKRNVSECYTQKLTLAERKVQFLVKVVETKAKCAGIRGKIFSPLKMKISK